MTMFKSISVIQFIVSHTNTSVFNTLFTSVGIVSYKRLSLIEKSCPRFREP